jgi:ElaB/YqjD/DUF883 family membrane-anchored ribosome-binding protein
LVNVVDEEGDSNMEMKEQIQDRVHELEGRVRPRIDAVKETLSTLGETVGAYLKSHPTQSLLGAIAVGYIFGRVARGGRGRE